MKHCDSCGRIPFFWELALGFCLLFDLSTSQETNSFVYCINLTLHLENWVMSDIYQLILLKDNFPPRKMAGVLVLPEGDAKNACEPETNFSLALNTEDWITFIERRGCSFKDKIKSATGKGTAILIYDCLCLDRKTWKDTGDIATITISSPKGKQMSCLLQEGIQVTSVTEVEKTLWKIYLCACCLISTLVAYVLLCCTPGQVMVRREEQRTQTVKPNCRKTLYSLELRRLKKDDFDLAEETCVICLETYRPREVLCILMCRHVFHKRCIDRWLLNRRICPICNHVIQKSRWGNHI